MLSSPNRSPARRLTSLDALRGLSVFAMIEQHLGIWLWSGPAPGLSRLDYPGLVAFNVALVMGAPMFYVLSGVGTAIMCARWDERGAATGRTDAALDRRLLRRGALLYAFGIAVNLATPSWFSWGSFFALHLMGVGIATSPLWRRLSQPVLLSVAAVVLALTPVVQLWLEIPAELTNDDMRDTSLAGGALRLALCGSQYSLLPWLTTYLLGFWAGRQVTQNRLTAVARLGTALVGCGALGALLWLVADPPAQTLLWYAFEIHLGWFPPSVAIVALLTGPTLWVLVIAVRRDHRCPLRADHPLVLLGRISLTVFVLHAPVFRELSRPIGLWEGLSAPWTLVAIALFTLASVGLARWWARYDFRYGAEWVLRRLAD